MAERSATGSSCAPSPAVLAGLVRELKALKQSPADGIRVSLNESNVADVQAEIDGPTGTPFEGGRFRLKLVLGADFPRVPPKGYFITPIFHPNVSKSGDICVNTLKQDWKPSHGIRHILMVIRCLLIEPFPESALNEEASRLALEDYHEYERRARLMASIHAIAAGPGEGKSPKSKAVPLSTDVANRLGPQAVSSLGVKSPKMVRAKTKKSLKRL